MAKGNDFKVKLNKDSKRSKMALIEALDGSEGIHWRWKKTPTQVFNFDKKDNVLKFFKKNYPKHEVLD